MASHKAALPPDTLHTLSIGLKDAASPVLVFSNNHPERVGKFCEPLGVGYISHAGKPFSRGFRKAANRLGLSMREIAVIGDQIFTDVFGGNRAGALTCYVETLDRRFFWINVRYQLERGFIARGRRRMEVRAHHAEPKFGPAGNSESFAAAGFKKSEDAPAWLAQMGLTAFEYQCGRGVRCGEETALKIGAAAKQHGIQMSVHAPYFINLSSEESERMEKMSVMCWRPRGWLCRLAQRVWSCTAAVRQADP